MRQEDLRDFDKMTTYEQTVEIKKAGIDDAIFYGMEDYPVCPVSLEESKDEHGKFKPVQYRVACPGKEHFTITWYEGSVFQEFADGTTKAWWNKPTLAEAVTYNKRRFWNELPGFWKFNSDGSVYAKIYHGNYFWGPSRAVEKHFLEGMLEHAQRDEPHWCIAGHRWDFDTNCQMQCVYAEEMLQRYPSWESDDEYDSDDGWCCAHCDGPWYEWLGYSSWEEYQEAKKRKEQKDK